MNKIKDLRPHSDSVLGIDLGNTFIQDKKPLPDSFRVIRRLAEELFIGRVHIVSRVDERQEIRAREFVTGEEFRQHLDIPIDCVHFCRERHEKGPICRKIGITHFIDDRPEVMMHMPLIVEHKILFNPDRGDLEQYAGRLGPHRIVGSWSDVELLFFGA